MVKSIYSLDKQGIKVKSSNWNLSKEALVELVVQRKEGKLAYGGAIAIDTGKYTGRSPDDKFTVKDSITENTVDWSGKFNHSITPEVFDGLEKKVRDYISEKEVFVLDAWAGADKKYRIPVRFITMRPAHVLFASNMFVNATNEELQDFKPEYTVIQCPELQAVPLSDGTKTETFICLSLTKKMILIGGTEYSGEIKKGIFGVLNYILPEKKVMPMHCSANIGKSGDTAVFFGLSGTGKTTLSSDPNRDLIGDDEHGWSDDGVFNFEGGCYAKVIDLNKEAEPDIYRTTHTFGSILENIVMDEETRIPDFTNKSKTENTRVSYPITQVPNARLSGLGGHPKNIIMLTADAFGVLPPISKLTTSQAMYHFLSGYTAKVAGTERGVKEPQATFSTCFGAPFMPRKPSDYANLLGEKIKKHNVTCWLVNTGWTGGAYGVGSRMKLKYTRAMLTAALSGQLDSVKFELDKYFGLMVPTSCPDVPAEVLMPENTWVDKNAYAEMSLKLISMFDKNFEKYKDTVTKDILDAKIGNK